VLMMVFFIPAGVLLVAGSQSTPESVPVFAIVAYVAAIIPVAYLGVAWLFALPLIIDKRFNFWPAMEASRRVVNLHWFQVFGLLFTFGLLMMGIMMLLGGVAVLFGAGLEKVGEGAAAAGVIVPMVVMGLAILAVMPVFFAAIVYAYRDIFETTAEATAE